MTTAPSPSCPLRTERLLLRPLTAADRDALHAYRRLPEVCRYVPFPPMDLAEIDRRLAGMWSVTALPEEPGTNLALGVERDGTLIGDVVLMRTDATNAEIGYVFSPEAAGRGYATEAAGELLRLAFEDLGVHRVTARLDERNPPSARVLERLGMRREAHFVEDEWFKGEWSSTLVYAILDREWRGRAES